MDAPLEGRSYLVTGGGSGIGLACARALVAAGGRVTISGRTKSRLADAVASLVDGGAEPAAVGHVVGDVTDQEAMTAAVEVAAADGRLHGVVASAGGGSMNRIETTTTEEWTEVLDLVTTGTFLTLRAAVPALLAGAADVEGGSTFVGISSIAAHRTHRFMTPYAVAKAGLDMLIRQAADELGDRGIRANSVRPGLIDTDLVAMITDDETMRSDYLAQTPLGRVGTPDDVAAVVRFLSGPESRWVTGACVPVDGGHHLRRGPDFSPWFGDATD